MVKKAVLVVGGAGYIGSHTCLALREAGFSVVIYDNFSSGHKDACFADVVVEGELSDRDKLVDTIKAYNIGSVIHFAALIEAGISMVEPLSFFRNNVASTISLLEAMHDTGVHKIVFSSTAAAYGNVDGDALLDETLPIAPINPYGQSKTMVEAILQEEARARGLQAIALRYFNASGADPECRAGERHDPETHLIPLIIQAAAGQRADIKIFGTDYDTPDGTCIRDYIHVADLASGHVAALNKLLADDVGGFDRINLGTGKGHSVREVINAVRTISSRTFEVVECPRRPGDPARLVADATRAKEVLNWVASKADIETIVADAWRYANTNDR
ncbi:UNVERIFIED_CONTAM: hypothetical protein GTU68_006336 [Idotea baltica]|nr:hypothetical protein [Idotea baltica]